MAGGADLTRAGRHSAPVQRGDFWGQKRDPPPPRPDGTGPHLDHSLLKDTTVFTLTDRFGEDGSSYLTSSPPLKL